MSKIIKVSMDLEVTVHDYPEGTLETQNRQLCELIGDGCDMIENVMPKRLYRELGHTTTALRENSKCVSMLYYEIIAMLPHHHKQKQCYVRLVLNIHK